MSKLGLYLHFFAISTRFMLKQKWMSLTSTLSITLVVIVLIGFLSMAKGFEKALTNSGSENIGIALSSNAQTEITSDVSQEQVEILRGLVTQAYGSKQVISPELVIIVSGNLRGSDKKININLRGLYENAVSLHEGFELVAGRMFRPGTAELIVGENLSRRVSGLDIGNEVRLGGVDWRIVGTFKLQGNLFESEVWGSVQTVQSDFERQNQFQSVRMPIVDEDSLINLMLLIGDERRLDLILQTEKEYFVQQSSSTVGLIKYIGWPLAIILSIGAFCGTFNTLKMAVDARQHELKILSLLGFQRSIAFFMLMYEAFIFSLIGGVLGIVISWSLFDGLLASTFGSSFNTVSFALHVDSLTSLQAFGLAVAVGLFSGLIPAYSGMKVRAGK
ncbi:ABC transporter permease [Paraneptunicella aestuarii]|uniref:ABC transporter permease n=1 Tax=Paraneptunicella aestuarii TaxID=2831148 RepID=UPI001E6487B0|nr:FtsX-like permease family protein [Paraneptunicella aestuarii]UAA40057.1 ABC transporter permease [Paraneptunicella aestuarii]